MTPPEIRRLDFSEFHPLDHSVLRCNGFPGGRRRHLEYRWDFQWSYRVRRWTLCLVRRHDPAQWTRRGKPVCTRCRNCYKEIENV